MQNSSFNKLTSFDGEVSMGISSGYGAEQVCWGLLSVLA